MRKMMFVLASTAFVVAAAVGVHGQQPARGRGQQPAARGTPPPPPQPLTVAKFVGHDMVAGCSKAATLVSTPEYNVSCSNRTGPGVVEIHTKETDVIYVIDGAATFVTGGTALNVTATNSLQPRGTDIQGGETHHLVKGDVIAVPAGIPHWFKEVPSSVSYYVVKVLKP
jgi:mannose-6-phosphate isomerase-like protein (cupin superfamily)